MASKEEISTELNEIKELLKIGCAGTVGGGAPSLNTIGLSTTGTFRFSLSNPYVHSLRGFAIGGDVYLLLSSGPTQGAFKFTSGASVSFFDNHLADLTDLHAFVFSGVSATLSLWLTNRPT